MFVVGVYGSLSVAEEATEKIRQEAAAADSAAASGEYQSFFLTLVHAHNVTILHVVMLSTYTSREVGPP